MRKIFVICAFAMFVNFAFCQKSDEMAKLIRKLRVSDPQTNARVEVVNHIKVDLIHEPEVVDGYKIRLVFDNSQNARDSVANERRRYLAIYPRDSTYIEYQSPYFKLTVGNFLTHEEALIRWNRVVKHFRSAFIVNEKISINQFMSERRRYELGEISFDQLY